MEKENNIPNVESVGVGLPPELPSHEENKEKLVESLHQDSALPNLRTYKGDVAEFIKSKDQSLSGIAIKEHEKKKEEVKKLEKEIEHNIEIGDKKAVKELRKEEKSFHPPKSLPTNFLIYRISLCLLLGVGITVSYVFIFNKDRAPLEVTVENSIIAAQQKVVIDSTMLLPMEVEGTFSDLKSSPDYKTGVTLISVSNSANRESVGIDKLIGILAWSTPSALRRTFNAEHMLGLYGRGNTTDTFIVLKVKDHGIAFRDMLGWEENLLKDWNPLLTQSSDASTTPYVFKDLLVRNKDTRAALSPKGGVRLIYTFLDKETVLITESKESLISLLDAFVLGNMTR